MRPPDELHPDTFQSHELYAFDAPTDAVVGFRLTVHPVRHIADAAFSVVHRGRQRSLHASRRLPPDGDVVEVGPIGSTADPEDIGMRVDAPELGVRASISGVAPGGPAVAWHDTEVQITVDGTELLPRRAMRCLRRDVAGIGPSPPGTYGAPPLELPRFLRWTVTVDGPVGSLDSDGSPSALTATWAPGTRWCAGGSLRVDGVDHDFISRARLPMRGLGFDDVQWSAGRWHDELAVGGQSWELDDLDPTDVHNLRTMHAIELDDGRFGFLDLVAVGPSAAHGLTGFSDGFREAR